MKTKFKKKTVAERLPPRFQVFLCGSIPRLISRLQMINTEAAKEGYSKLWINIDRYCSILVTRGIRIETDIELEKRIKWETGRKLVVEERQKEKDRKEFVRFKKKYGWK